MPLELSKISSTIHHTDDWLKERLGLFTSSRAGELVGEKSHNGIFSQGAESYIIDMSGERVTGRRSKQEFFTDATNWGNANEADAIIRTCEITKRPYILRNNDGSTHRFIRRNKYEGSTPDCLTVDHEDVNKCFDASGEKIKVIPTEVKSPPTFNVFGRFLAAKTPADIKRLDKKYYFQVLHQMISADSLLAYFGVYHPEFTNNCNVVTFRQLELLEDIKLFKATLDHAAIQFDKWVEIFNNKKSA